jgi:hypothetical protein
MGKVSLLDVLWGSVLRITLSISAIVRGGNGSYEYRRGGSAKVVIERSEGKKDDNNSETMPSSVSIIVSPFLRARTLANGEEDPVLRYAAAFHMLSAS